MVSRRTGVKLFFLGLLILFIAWGLARAGQSSFPVFVMIGGFMTLGGFLYAWHPDEEQAEPEEYASSTQTVYNVETESKPEKHETVEAFAQPQVIREVIKEKETIREIVKIRCRHCGELFEEKKTRCPYCNAPA